MSDPVLVDSADDPFYSDVVCLLKMNGADAGTVFTDEIGHTFTAHGDAKTTTSTYFSGGSSGSFDGTGDYIDSPDGTAMSPGAGQFTIDMLVKFNAVGNIHLVGCSSGTYYLNYEWSFFMTNSTTLNLYYGVRGSSNVVLAFAVPAIVTGNFYHLAVQRTVADVVECFTNGIKSANTYASTLNYTGNAAHKLTVGAFGVDLSSPLNGYMNSLRITRNTRYSGSFKPFDSYHPPKLYTPKVQPFSFLPYGA